jgi:TetR/AcrR family transcriptional regulator
MSRDIEKKILDATLEIIAREKISGTRMHLIAEEANMSQSNLHYYFPTKNDLIIAVMDDLQKRFSEKRTESVDLENKSLVENLNGLFEEKKDDILNHKKVDYAQFDFWVQGTVNPDIKVKFQNTFDEWRNSIKEVIKNHKYPSNIESKYVEMLPFITVSLLMGASMQYLIDEGKFDLGEYFLAAEKLVLNYLETMA